MGSYQLSRLYYCFSTNKVYSNKGYSNKLFIIMTIIAIIIIISIPLTCIFSETCRLRSKCGLNDEGDFIYTQLNISVLQNDYGWSILAAATYWFWDIATLLLYAFKIRSFSSYKKTEPIVYKRILSILYKIFIMTLFYEIITLISITFIWSMEPMVKHIIWMKHLIIMTMMNLITVSFSFAMYLMMPHNDREYMIFLKSVYWLKLNYVFCCCCGKIVYLQIKEIDGEDQILPRNARNADEPYQDKEKSIETTEWATIDPHDQKIDNNGCELSIATQTIVD